MAKTMDTDSFILALRRFMATRGNVRSIICDNGSNLVGAEGELAKFFEEMDYRKIKFKCKSHGWDMGKSD